MGSRRPLMIFSDEDAGPVGFRKVWWLGTGGIALASLLFGFQNAPKAWREYPAFEYNDFPIPPDSQETTEWAFGRLMYPNTTNPNIWADSGSSAGTARIGARADAVFSGRWISRVRTGTSRWPSGGSPACTCARWNSRSTWMTVTNTIGPGFTQSRSAIGISPTRRRNCYAGTFRMVPVLTALSVGSYL